MELIEAFTFNINKNTDEPKCCYRLYKTISEDIGLSERYISRIVEILDVMNIVKCQECKRERYKDGDGKYGFLTTPKVFADYRHFIKDQYGNNIVDQKYDYLSEIQRQMIILREDSA